MKVNTVTVTEGINHTFPICALLNNLSGILTTSISVGVVTKDVSSSAHGEHTISSFALFICTQKEKKNSKNVIVELYFPHMN